MAPLRTRSGDIVEVMPDGWKWSPAEEANTDYLRIDIPGVASSVFSDMLAEALSPEGAMKLKRAKRLDMANAKIVALLAKARNADGSVTVAAAKLADLTGAKQVREVPTKLSIK